MREINAIEAFNTQVQNINHLLRAADVYTQHLVAAMRGNEVDHDLIRAIVDDGKISTMNYSWRFFLSEREYECLKIEGQTRKICEEIVLSIYTALEQYLILKFREYLQDRFSNQPNNIYVATEKRTSYRSLRQIKDNYRDYLDIHLPSFETNLRGIQDSWFRPKSSWEGLTLLSDARNEIAHEGTSSSFEIIYLIDAYAPLHFIQRWVPLFNSNFDASIYEGRAPLLIREHNIRYRKINP